MGRKKVLIHGLSLVLLMGIVLIGSLSFSAESLPPGSKLPEFKLKGPDSPQAKAYLGLNDGKPFSLPQIKTKLTLIEFFDVF